MSQEPRDSANQNFHLYSAGMIQSPYRQPLLIIPPLLPSRLLFSSAPGTARPNARLSAPWAAAPLSERWTSQQKWGYTLFRESPGITAKRRAKRLQIRLRGKTQSLNYPTSVYDKADTHHCCVSARQLRVCMSLKRQGLTNFSICSGASGGRMA